MFLTFVLNSSLVKVETNGIIHYELSEMLVLLRWQAFRKFSFFRLRCQFNLSVCFRGLAYLAEILTFHAA